MNEKKVSYSPEQAKFIEVDDCNVIVSASAGSGKTFTMIEKLCNLITLKKTTIDKILLTTFSVAAGNEIKQRLFTKLSEKAESGDPYIIEQLNLLDNADIGTLHSICKKLISKYFYKLDIDPSFVVLENNETEYLKATAIDNVIKNYTLKNDDEYALLYDIFSSGRKDDGLRDTISTLYQYLCSISDAESWKKKAILECDKDYNDTVWAKFLFDTSKKEILSYENDITIARDFMSTICPDSSGYKAIENIYNVINNVKQIGNAKDLSAMLSGVEKIRWNVPKLDIDTADKIKVFQELKGDFDKSIASIISNLCYTGDRYYGEMTAYKRTMTKLFEVTDAVIKEYGRLKAQQCGVDFNDLEKYTLKLLSYSDVLQEIRDTYTHIFIDEYQDINEVQETILNKITSGKNMNMIGDVKQSIYGFRLCTPKIFIDKYYKYKESGNDCAIDFNDNYRSNNLILDSVNYVFDTLITKDSMNIDYKGTSRLSGPQPTQKVSDGYVELSLIDKPKKSKDDEDTLDEDDEVDYEYESRLVYDKINECINNKVEYTDIKTGIKKNFDFGDIAILVRDKGQTVRGLYTYLVTHNVPVSLTFKNALFNTREISMIYGILKCVNNEYDDIALVTYLLSPLGGLSADDLASIRLLDKKAQMYDLVLNYDMEDNLGQKIKTAFARLKEYRHFLLNNSINELINFMLYHDNLFSEFDDRVGGDEAMKNISEFMKLLGANSVNHSLSVALSYLKILEDKEDFEISVSDSNSVKIMTMHASKGLEFPMVIMYNLAKNAGGGAQNILIDDDLFVGLKNKDIVSRVSSNTPAYTANMLSQKLDEGSDLVRLLYVAMTRAKNRLYMIGTTTLESVKTKKNILDSSNSLDLILRSLSSDILTSIKSGVDTDIHLSSGDMHIKIYEHSDIVDRSNTKTKIMQGRVIEKEKLAIERLVNMDYKYLVDENIAVKNTVTELLHEQNDYENVIATPKSLLIDEGIGGKISGAEIGTAYHHIMQNIDYKSSYNFEKIEKIVDSVVDEDVRKNISIGKVLTAVDTISALIDTDSKVYQEAQFMYRDAHNKIVASSESDALVMVQGVVDLLILGKDNNILIDYKTNKFKTHKEYIDTYKLQLEIYKNAVEKGFNIKLDQVFIYSFELNTLIKI